MGRIEDLEKLQKLKEIGALTEEEFEKEKKAILNNNSNTIYQENQQNNVPKKKLKIWQIVLIIMSILLVRFCDNCYWNGSYRKL